MRASRTTACPGPSRSGATGVWTPKTGELVVWPTSVERNWATASPAPRLTASATEPASSAITNSLCLCQALDNQSILLSNAAWPIPRVPARAAWASPR